MRTVHVSYLYKMARRCRRDFWDSAFLTYLFLNAFYSRDTYFSESVGFATGRYGKVNILALPRFTCGRIENRLSGLILFFMDHAASLGRTGGVDIDSYSRFSQN